MCYSDTWNDVDGDAFVTINYPYIEISSTNTFYYFDKILDSIKDGKIVFLCIGNSDESDRQTDCFYQVNVEVKYRNDGYVRVISYEVTNSKFAFEAFEHYLSEGNHMKLTLDDTELYVGYNLHNDFKLSEISVKNLGR